jgi:hypothetical protein
MHSLSSRSAPPQASPTRISPTKRKQPGAGQSFTTRSDELKPVCEAIARVRPAPTVSIVRTAIGPLGQRRSATIHCRGAWKK